MTDTTPNVSKSERLTISYHDNDDSKSIIGSEFALSISGFVRMFERAQTLIANDEPKVALRFQAIEPGSVELVSIAEFLEQLPLDVFDPHIIPVPIFLKDSVVAFLREKILRRTGTSSDDRTLENTGISRQNPNMTIINVGGTINNFVEANNYTAEQADALKTGVRQLQEDDTMQRHARDFVSPLKGHTDKIDIKRDDDTLCSLGKQDVDLFDIDASDDKKTADILDPVDVNLIRVNFASGKGWRVKFNSTTKFGETATVGVEVVDQQFLATFDFDTRIGKPDVMHCRVEMGGPVDGKPSDHDIYITKVHQLVDREGLVVYPCNDPNQMKLF